MEIERTLKVLTTRIRQRQLMNFIAIYEEKNIVAAASRVSLTQSTLSKSLGEMEQALECKLFVRLPRGVRPTPEGDILYRHTKLLLSQHRQAAEELSRLSAPDSGQLVLGCGYVWDSVVVQAIAKFKNKYPNITIRVHFASDAELNRSIRRAEYDLLFGRLFSEFQHPDLVQERLFLDPVFIMVRHDHPALKRGSLELADLLEYPWLLPLPTAMIRRYFDQMFFAKKLPLPTNIIECSSMLTARSLLLGVDHLVSMPPSTVFAEELESGIFIKPQLSGLETEVPVGFTWRNDAAISEAQLAFQDSVRSIINPHQ